MLASSVTVNLLPAILQTGDLQPVAVVAKEVTGRRPSPPTVTRWIRSGVGGGVTLAAVYHVGKWMTNRAAFEQFIAAQTAARMSPKESDMDSATDAELQSIGLL